MAQQPDSTDIVVIGGGVVGLACAHELARQGASVCLLERDRVGHACSFGNAGWLTPSQAMPLAAPGQWRKGLRWLFDPDSPFHIRPRADPALLTWLIGFVAASTRSRFERGLGALVELSLFSVDAWEKLSAEAGTEPFGFARKGLLAIYETPKALDAASCNALLTEKHGVPFETWDAEELLQREPAIQGETVGGLFFPRDAQCEPYPAARALADAAGRAGVTLIEDAEVLDADGTSNSLRSVRTKHGPVSADQFVLAAGAWSRSLGKRLGVKIPVLGAKGYSLVVPRLDPHPRRSLYLAERKIAINPHDHGLRISGTLELVGEDLTVNRRRVDAIIRGARGMLAIGDDAELADVWCGLRPCMPDGMPVIGRSRSLSNLWLATGHQMTGLKTAPGTGKLLAELINGRTPSFDPEPFRADRSGIGG